MLLDTHVLLWLAGGIQLEAQTLRLLGDEAADGKSIYVSPISAWEVSMLIRKGRIRLGQPTDTWFLRQMDRPGFTLAPLTVEAAIEAPQLEGLIHADPMDRLLIATARALDVPLLTRDRAILDYAHDTGEVRAVPC